jgi:hypothetical protein
MALFVDSLSHAEQLKDIVAYIRALTVVRDGESADVAAIDQLMDDITAGNCKSVITNVLERSDIVFSHGASDNGTLVLCCQLCARECIHVLFAESGLQFDRVEPCLTHSLPSATV